MYEHVKKPKSFKFWLTLSLSILFSAGYNADVLAENSTRKTIKELYITLADHYAASVAYGRYRDKMQYADFQLQQIMDFAIEGEILNEAVDMDTFTDERFAITETELSTNQAASSSKDE
jgi:hypothetical protein